MNMHDRKRAGPAGLNERRRAFIVGAPLAVGVLALRSPAAFAASRQDDRAFASWTAAPVSAAPSEANRVNNQTIRNVIRTSLGGDSMRVNLSNRYGSSTLIVEAAFAARGNGNANIIAGSGSVITFGGRTRFTIPAYGELVSDWIRIPVPSLSEIAVDIYIASDTAAGTSALTIGNLRPTGQVGAYLANGNETGTPTLPVAQPRTAWYFLTGIDVSSASAPGSVVCFGDSITHGSQSTPYANQRYPDFLAERVFYSGRIAPMGVVNEGIGGNRVLNGGVGDSALARFDRDVLAQAGLSHIIVLEGINDISGGYTAERVIEGHKQIIQRAHAKRLKIYGGTLTPYGNAPDAREQERLTVNRWIRSSGAYDAVIDFELAVRDPANPRRMLARYDSGDSLHPNSLGYAAMADAIDLSLLAGYRIPL